MLGVSTPHGDGVAQLAFFGLFALQHRGQEAAGIAVSDGSAGAHAQGPRAGHQRVHPDGDGAAHRLPRHRPHPVLHHRRARTDRNIQPFLVETMHGPLALAHNGNLVNAPSLRDELLARGFGLTATSDTEVMTLMLAAAGGQTWEDRIERTLPAWKGAYSLVLLAVDRVLAVRDPWGFRPLSVGRLPQGGHAVASETCALSHARLRRHLRGRSRARSSRCRAPRCTAARRSRRRRARRAARSSSSTSRRPDSVWDGRNVHHVRQRLGEELAHESPVDADVVIPVPDSSIPAAIGYARASGVPFNDGLIKNRYIGRTFIEPSQDIRERGVALKFNALAENLAGERVVMIDDSLVRGTTAGPLVKLVRDAGATEVHLRITCPPIMHPCHFGVDMGHDGDLMAARLDVDEIRDHIGADCLAFLSLDGMMRAIGHGDPATSGYCNACFTGRLPDRGRRGPGQARLRRGPGVMESTSVAAVTCWCSGGGRERAIAWACRQHGHEVTVADELPGPDETATGSRHPRPRDGARRRRRRRVRPSRRAVLRADGRARPARVVEGLRPPTRHRPRHPRPALRLLRRRRGRCGGGVARRARHGRSSSSSTASPPARASSCRPTAPRRSSRSTTPPTVRSCSRSG